VKGKHPKSLSGYSTLFSTAFPRGMILFENDAFYLTKKKKKREEKSINGAL
jgi:hypothetical protein